MSEPKFTAGPYERVGTTVYALQHYGWRKGKEEFCNRIYANVQRGPDCTEDEAEAVARLFQAAPEMFEAIQSLVDWCDKSGQGEALWCVQLARAALDKATGEA